MAQPLRHVKCPEFLVCTHVARPNMWWCFIHKMATNVQGSAQFGIAQPLFGKHQGHVSHTVEWSQNAVHLACCLCFTGLYIDQTTLLIVNV